MDFGAGQITVGKSKTEAGAGHAIPMSATLRAVLEHHAGVPESTMPDMMGHVSAAMLRRYSRIRAKARRQAIDALESGNSFGVPKESPKIEAKEEKGKTVTAFVS